MFRRFFRVFSVFLSVACAAVVAALFIGSCGSTTTMQLPPTPTAATAIVTGTAAQPPVTETAVVVRPTIAPTEAPVAEPTDEPTVVPTETPEPEPTVALVAAQSLFDRHFARSDLVGKLVPPIDCNVLVDLDADPAILFTTFQCPQETTPVSVKAGRAGRIAMVVNTVEGQLMPPPTTYEEWTWQRGLSLGNYVVIDHGPVAPWSNLMTLHGGLSKIPDDLTLGQQVEAEHIIGRLDAGAQLQYEIWPQGQPLTVVASEPPEREATPADLANKFALSSVPPVDPVCRFPAREPSSLPNAPRPYRNGTHQGVDFVCLRTGLDAYAFADGQVAMVVRDYDDAQPADRNALLQSGVDMGGTPHWTLMMLYGNFVVIDHNDLPDIGRSFTIYAHLEEVDEGVVLGQPIMKGTRVGEVGNRGTSNAAANTTADNLRSLHLHWELHVEGQYLGAGLSAEESETAYRLLLCDEPALLEGC